MLSFDGPSLAYDKREFVMLVSESHLEEVKGIYSNAITTGFYR